MTSTAIQPGNPDVNPIGAVAQVQKSQAAGLLNDDGTLACPIQSTPLTPDLRFLVEGERGKTLYIRLLDGKHARRLAAIPQQELDVVGGIPSLLIA